MAAVEKTQVGRVFAYSHLYSGGAVTATRLYYDDGAMLLVEGHLVMAVPVTLTITYMEEVKKLNKVTKLELLGGGVS
jgi:hypothetical protein